MGSWILIWRNFCSSLAIPAFTQLCTIHSPSQIFCFTAVIIIYSSNFSFDLVLTWSVIEKTLTMKSFQAQAQGLLQFTVFYSLSKFIAFCRNSLVWLVSGTKQLKSRTLVSIFLIVSLGSLLASWKFTHWYNLSRSFYLDFLKEP